MTLKQQALLHVLKIIALGVTVGAAVSYLGTVFGAAVMGIVVAAALLVYMGYHAYDIKLTQLKHERDQIVKNLKD